MAPGTSRRGRAELVLHAARGPDPRRSGRGCRDAGAEPMTAAGCAGGATRTPVVAAALAEAAPDDFERQAPRRARAGAAGRGDRLGQLLDADPRRRGLLPAVAQAAALPRQPRRERDRRRRVVGAGAAIATGPPDLAADRRARPPARRRRPAGGAPRRRGRCRSSASTTAAAGSSTSCPSPSTPIPPPTRSTSPPRRRGRPGGALARAQGGPHRPPPERPAPPRAGGAGGAGALARRRSRPVDPAVVALARPCRRPSRPAGCRITTAASAIAAPAVSEPSSIGMRGRFSCSSTLYSEPKIAPATASTIVTVRPIAQVPKPWRAAVEARHAPAHVAAAVVRDRERPRSAGCRPRCRSSRRSRSPRTRSRLAQPERRAGRAQDRRAGSPPCRPPRASRRRRSPS